MRTLFMELRDLVLRDVAKEGYIEALQISKAVKISRSTLNVLFRKKNIASHYNIRKISLVIKRPIREYEECEFTLI